MLLLLSRTLAFLVIFGMAMGAALAKDEFRKLTSSSTGETWLLQSPPALRGSARALNGTTVTGLTVPGWNYVSVPRAPILPATGKLFNVPKGARITTEIEIGTPPIPYAHLSTLDTVTSTEKVPPAHWQHVGTPTVSGLLPGFLAAIGPTAIERGQTVAPLRFFPYQWDPSTGTVYYYPQLRLQLDWLASPPQANSDQSYPLPSIPFNAPALRIVTNQSGIHEVSSQDFVGAGFDPNLWNPKKLRLWHRGIETAITMRTTPSGSVLRFYAMPFDSPYANQDVYFLTWVGGKLQRMDTVDATPNTVEPVVAELSTTLHFEENHTTWDNTPNAPTEDYWFWAKLVAGSTANRLATTISVQDPVNSLPATIKLDLLGRSTGSHYVTVVLNGVTLGELTWSGLTRYRGELAIPASVLSSGDNNVVVQLANANTDIVYPNWLELTYTRQLIVHAGRTSLQTKQPTTMEVTGLTDTNAVVYDVTNPLMPKRLIGRKLIGTPDNRHLKLHLPIAGHYELVESSGLIRPVAMTGWHAPNLRNRRLGADYLVIAPRAFLGAINPLAKLRRSTGLRVKVIAVEDIADTFGGGADHARGNS
ncbi:exported hypothetical protein [Gammaproteobacteria bacterium]